MNFKAVHHVAAVSSVYDKLVDQGLAYFLALRVEASGGFQTTQDPHRTGHCQFDLYALFDRGVREALCNHGNISLDVHDRCTM